AMKASHSLQNMVVLPVFWSRTSISGRAQSGYGASSSSQGISRAFGRSLAITSTATHGVSSAMLEIEIDSYTHKRLIWRLAEVAKISDETPTVKSLVLDVPVWPGHRPGQHVDVRLMAEDGYQAQRSYSVASEPETGRLVLTVERDVVRDACCRGGA